MEIDSEVQKILKENQIWEMANLRKARTGLPVLIYISDDDQASHGPRIKFFDSYADKLGSNWDLLIPLTVSDLPEIPITYKLKNINKKDLEKIKQWVIQNKDLLLRCYKGEIDEIDVANMQQPYKN